MCGRFAASASTEEIIETFQVDLVVDEPEPTFNAAPTDAVGAVRERVDKESGSVVRKLVTPRWGLVPSWSKDAASGARMINARVETVATKPAFAKAFAARRCLIPADGYYEWETVPAERGRPAKLPWFIRPVVGPFVMAGIYEFWKDPAATGEGAWLTTCSIITTRATDALGRIHDRMPMTVPPDAWAAWLDPAATDAHDALGLLHAPAGDDVETFRVSTRVNSVRNDAPDLVDPLT